MARTKLGVDRKKLLADVHDECKNKVPLQVKELEMTVETVRGERKTYKRRVLTRNLKEYRDCIAETIRAKLEAKVKEVLEEARRKARAVA